MLHVWHIYTYIWVIFKANVGKYSMHGAYGWGYSMLRTWMSHQSITSQHFKGDRCADNVQAIELEAQHKICLHEE